MSGADNQQERLALVGYLAGIIDGEGWIGVTKHKNSEVRNNYSLIPQISVHMVGREAIDHVHWICETLGLPSYRIHLKTSSRWTIRGAKRVVPFLEEMAPFLFIKQRQALLVLEFAAARKLRHHHSAPSDREEDLAREISTLNTKGKNPQRLIRPTPETAKIESDLHGDMQSTAEMTVPA